MLKVFITTASAKRRILKSYDNERKGFCLTTMCCSFSLTSIHCKQKQKKSEKIILIMK